MTEEELKRKQLEKGCNHWVFNLQFAEKCYSVISLGSGQKDSLTRTCEVVTPVLTNSRAILKGEHLIVEVGKQKR